MANFILGNEERALELDAKLAELPFRDKETLVSMYNSGLINRKNEEVVELVNLMVEAYKGLERRPDEITFLSEGEISSEELLAKSEAFVLLLRVKRILQAASRKGLVSNGTHVYISKAGTVAAISEANGEEGTDGSAADITVSPEKLPKISKEAWDEAANLLGLTGFGENEAFEAARIFQVNESAVVNALNALR